MPPCWTIDRKRVACGTAYVVTSRLITAEYCTSGPSKSDTVQIPSSSRAASTWFTRDRSALTRWFAKMAFACVNHCCGECHQNPGNRTGAIASTLNGINVFGVATCDHVVSSVFALAAAVFGTGSLAFSESVTTLSSDNISAQVCMTCTEGNEIKNK